MYTLLDTKKRKWDGGRAHSDAGRRVKLKKTTSASDPTKCLAPLESSDESFSTDPITSDPTFFDDFIPQEMLPPTPVASLPSSPPPEFAKETAHDQRQITSAGSRSKQSASLSRLDRDVVEVESDKQTIQNESSRREDDNIPPEAKTSVNDVASIPREIATEHIDRMFQAVEVSREYAVKPTQQIMMHSTPHVDTPGRRNSDPNSVSTATQRPHSHADAKLSVRRQLDATSQPDVLIPISEPLQPGLNPNAVQVHDTAPVPLPASNTEPISHTIANKTRSVVARRRRGTEMTSERDSLMHDRTSTVDHRFSNKSKARKKEPSRRKRLVEKGLDFNILEEVPAPHLAYAVQHFTENASNTGSAWQRSEQHAHFYKSVTEFAKLKYNVGNMVKISFPHGQGGAARIVEIRGDEECCIVIQWVYSKTDVARCAGKLPSLNHWPKGMCMLSDHFQIVGAENVDGGSGLMPVDGVYWQAEGKCLRPFSELQKKLDAQFA